MKTYVFVPYSGRSFDGICADVRRHFGDEATIVALYLEHETPPPGLRLAATKYGDVGLIALERGGERVVVANGGPTPLGVAAVLLSQRIGARLVNVQRDEIIEMRNNCEYN